MEFGQVAKRALSVRDLSTRTVERAGLPATALSARGEGDAPEVWVSEGEVKFEVLDRGPGIEGDFSVKRAA